MFCNIFGFMDGTVMDIQRPGDADLQELYYSGYYGGHKINNVFVFAPTGVIIAAEYNCPGTLFSPLVLTPFFDAGSFHDVRASQRIYQVLLDDAKTPPPFKLAADSGFQSRLMACKIATPLKENQFSDDPDVQAEQKEVQRRIVRVRQACGELSSSKSIYICPSLEWGMRALKGSFPRLKTELTWDKHHRRAIIELCLLLHNVRVRLVGVNQLRNYYLPLFVQGQESPDYDRVMRVYGLS